MPKRTIATVLAVLLFLSGCSVRKVQQVPAASLPQPQNEKIVGITTVKGEDVSFDAPGAIIAGGTLRAAVKKPPTTFRWTRRNGTGWSEREYRPGESSDWSWEA